MLQASLLQWQVHISATVHARLTFPSCSAPSLSILNLRLRVRIQRDNLANAWDKFTRIRMLFICAFLTLVVHVGCSLTSLSVSIRRHICTIHNVKQPGDTTIFDDISCNAGSRCYLTRAQTKIGRLSWLIVADYSPIIASAFWATESVSK